MKTVLSFKPGVSVSKCLSELVSVSECVSKLLEHFNKRESSQVAALWHLEDDKCVHGISYLSALLINLKEFMGNKQEFGVAIAGRIIHH